MKVRSSLWTQSMDILALQLKQSIRLELEHWNIFNIDIIISDITKRLRTISVLKLQNLTFRCETNNVLGSHSGVNWERCGIVVVSASFWDVVIRGSMLGPGMLYFRYMCTRKNQALNIRDCVSLVGRRWSAASKLGQVCLPHIASVVWMRRFKPLVPSIASSIWCLCQGK